MDILNNRNFYQAVMFGIVTVLLGLLFGYVFSSLKPELPAECEIWDKYYVMEIILFATGFTMRFILTQPLAIKYLYDCNVNSSPM